MWWHSAFWQSVIFIVLGATIAIIGALLNQPGIIAIGGTCAIFFPIARGLYECGC